MHNLAANFGKMRDICKRFSKEFTLKVRMDLTVIIKKTAPASGCNFEKHIKFH
jgi:hypothetical protein